MTQTVDISTKESQETSKGWQISDNHQHYWIQEWGEGYFHINEEGNVAISPSKDKNCIDLYRIVQSLVERGVEAPILFRFDGIIRSQIHNLTSAFQEAIEHYDYKNSYRLVYPIKVNQNKHVIDSLRSAGKRYNMGLEVGSKPELLAILGVDEGEDSLFLCNGYKDSEYIELALLSRKLGRRCIIIIEQPYECKMILETAERLGIEAEVGFRMKPSVKGSGRWASSGGEAAKFGLDIHEILSVFEELKKAGKTDWLKLLHFHIGSQISSILPLKKALSEAACLYAELARDCTFLEFFDVGGGLAVDYNGSKTIHDSSMNYTIREYARDIVSTIKDICTVKNIREPVIITESGRAIVAHHSLLVTEVIDVAKSLSPIDKPLPPPSNHSTLLELSEIYQGVTSQNYMEALHDTSYIKQRILEEFIHGDIDLEERAYGEELIRYLIAKIYDVAKDLQETPKEVRELSEKLLDVYFCNFSVFQSLPDSWAIQQLFPVMPIHNLHKEPTRKAIIVDLSCDSDGKIDRFIHPQKVCSSILLHDVDLKTPYYLGVFLTGAYQETLGGLHNLFGDTNAVHVDFDEEGNWQFKNLIEGDTMSEVLQYMHYNTDILKECLHRSTEKALRKKILSNEDVSKIKKKFNEALKNYTYLVV